MPAFDEKKAYFDEYWREQPTETADPRAIERAAEVERMIENKGGDLLDVGCGRGLALDYFAERGFKTTGVDISPEAIRLIEQKGHRGYLLDLENVNLSGKYDIIVCLEVLQQVFNPKAVLSKIISALKDGGELFISLPNEFHVISRIKALFGISHLGDFHHSHIRLFSPKRNMTLFKEAGLRIEKTAHIPIVPPKWKILSALCQPLANIFPSLLAISSIYKAKPK
jgi:2-polyprenyl-6-hydroxyphenyl methylase/3-demethylubiquinone-9 3-methyltransferase